MLKKKMIDAISQQINVELGSAYLYLAISAKLENMSFPGGAHWMLTQTQEELNHAMLLMRYLIDRDSPVDFMNIKIEEPKLETLKDAFDAAYKHEVYVSGTINKLAALAAEEQDYMFMNFLQYFLSEQVEEEKNAKTIVDKLKLAGNSHDALLFIDAELATRAAVAPNPAGSMTLAKGAGA